jgi:chorismate synthase
MSSTFGTIFRITTFGESHGGAVGAVVDGCPPRLALTEADIQPQLDRRRPGQSALTTPRGEPDAVRILSGTELGVTLGTPIALVVANRDTKPGDYAEMSNVPRPSHADFTYQVKYGVRAASGGGRSSARETIGRVAAGAIAEKWLRLKSGVEIVAWVSGVGAVEAPDLTGAGLTRAAVDANAVRCPDAAAARQMETEILAARDAKDSVGGIITCVCRGVSPGWGEPVFHKLEAMLAQAMLSLPATKGFELGSGFAGTRWRGSAHNDAFVQKSNGLGTKTNYSGGIQGGISNGEPIVFRVAFKPPATISQPQQTADFDGRPTTLEAKGRHDPCVVPRAVPIVEAMAALVLADAALQQQARS